MNNKLDSHLGSLIDIESKLDFYADSYKENQGNVYCLDDRLATAEDNLRVEVPEYLKVPHFGD